MKVPLGISSGTWDFHRIPLGILSGWKSQRDVKLFSDPAGISQREIHPQLTGAAGAKRAKDSLSLAPKLGRIAWQTIIAIIRCVDKFGVVGKNHAEFNPEGGTVLQLKQLPSLLGHWG